MPASSVCSQHKKKADSYKSGTHKLYGFLFYCKQLHKRSFVVFAAVLLWKELGLIMKAGAHGLLDLLFLKSAKRIILGSKDVINIFWYLCYRRALFFCEVAPSEH